MECRQKNGWMMFLLLLLALAGCRQAPAEHPASQTPSSKTSPSERSADGIHKEFIEAERLFGISVFHHLIEQQGTEKNVFISPYSIQQALVMTANGADGETKEEMKNTLLLSEMKDREINEAANTLMNSFRNLSDGELLAAHSVWTGLDINPQFKQTIEQYFDGKACKLGPHPEKAKRKINEWAAKKTKGHIEDIAGNLSPNTIAVLLNTIYFQGDWAQPFDKAMTYVEPLYLQNGAEKKHPMMKQTALLPYQENELFQAVKLSYKNKDLSFAVFLPQKDKDLSSLTAALTHENMEKWENRWEEKMVKLSLPRFSFEEKYNLRGILAQLGMKTAFGNADFSKLFLDKSTDAKIDDVNHHTFIKTDETGTEAAAATSVEIIESASEPELSLTVNRPFLFVIADEKTKSILFLGTVAEPAD
ncbi:MAG: serpin family protein [Bacillota bacterium]